jgi:hypothetical protein
MFWANLTISFAGQMKTCHPKHRKYENRKGPSHI